MKKALLALSLVIAFTLGASAYVGAQDSPIQQCRMLRALDYGNITAGENDTVGAEGTGADHEGEEWAVMCMINTINRTAQVLFTIMMGIVVALVIFGGFLILGSGGNPESVEKGKKYITFAVFGVLVAVFAYAVPAILNLVLR